MPRSGAGRKLFPSAGGVQGWVERRRRTHPEGYAFCPSEEGIFTKVFHAGRDTTFDENKPTPPLKEKV
jgi:hypothetical protein